MYHLHYRSSADCIPTYLPSYLLRLYRIPCGWLIDLSRQRIMFVPLMSYAETCILISTSVAPGDHPRFCRRSKPTVWSVVGAISSSHDGRRGPTLHAYPNGPRDHV